MDEQRGAVLGEGRPGECCAGWVLGGRWRRRGGACVRVRACGRARGGCVASMARWVLAGLAGRVTVVDVREDG